MNKGPLGCLLLVALACCSGQAFGAEMPKELIGYWCFSRPYGRDMEPDVKPIGLATSLNDCWNNGGVHFRRSKSSYKLGRFETRRNCKISHIEQIPSKGPKVYRVHSDCDEDPRGFEVWRHSKTELRWRDFTVDEDK